MILKRGSFIGISVELIFVNSAVKRALFTTEDTKGTEMFWERLFRRKRGGERELGLRFSVSAVSSVVKNDVSIDHPLVKHP